MLSSYYIQTVSKLGDFSIIYGFVLASKVATLLGMGLISFAVATVVISVQKEFIDRDLRRTKEKLSFFYNELGRRRTSMFTRFSTILSYPIEGKVFKFNILISSSSTHPLSLDKL